MIKHNGMYFITAPRFEPNSCKGCYWYPSKDIVYTEAMIYRQGSVYNYLLAGCLKMHQNQSGSVCTDLNVIFTKVSNKNEK